MVFFIKLTYFIKNAQNCIFIMFLIELNVEQYIIGCLNFIRPFIIRDKNKSTNAYLNLLFIPLKINFISYFL